MVKLKTDIDVSYNDETLVIFNIDTKTYVKVEFDILDHATNLVDHRKVHLLVSEDANISVIQSHDLARQIVEDYRLSIAQEVV